MTRLVELLPFNSGETIASYCSRLAAASGYGHAYSFGTDHGFRFLGLAVGNQTAVDAFAGVLEVRPSDLSPGVIKSDGKMMSVGRSERLDKSQMERRRIRYCPHCVRDDENLLEGRRGHRTYGRLVWQIRSVRSCQKHGVQLVTSPQQPQRIHLYDFTSDLAAETERLGSAMFEVQSMPTDSLQTYIEARLLGQVTNAPWLDSLPLFVAIKTCETVGASERHGIQFDARKFDVREWAACGGAGFDLVREGRHAFREALHRQMIRDRETHPRALGRSVLTKLYKQLTYNSFEEGYRQVRDVIREVGLNTVPLSGDDYFLGPVGKRRIHSVQSAAKEFNLGASRLRNQLINAGVIPPSARNRSPERILLEAQLMEEFVVNLRSQLDTKAAREYVGADEISFRTLVNAGTIPVSGRNATGKLIGTEWTFAPADLDKFLARLTAAATGVDRPGLSGLQQAVHDSNSSLVRVVQLIFGGGLKTVALSPNKKGLAAVRLDISEIRRNVAVEPHGCYAIRVLGSVIPTSGRVATALVAEGRLPTVRRAIGYRGIVRSFVEPAAVERFKKEFVSLGNLSRLGRTTSGKLQTIMEAANVVPAFVAGGMAFYRRSDVRPWDHE